MNKILLIRVLIGLLGLIVGISYLRMSLGDPLDTRNFIIGLICAILGFVWLVRSFITYKALGRSDNSDRSGS
jgi:hypothetical protein